MKPVMERIVIAGAGVAAGRAAVTLREEGFDGEVVLIGAEDQPPYYRPALSKEYLRGEQSLDQVRSQPDQWYADQRISLRLGERVVEVKPQQHSIRLESGEELSYDRLLLATGGHNRQLSIPGADLPHLHYLRSLEEADSLKSEARPGRRAVVIGMGFIGCEVAASLRQLGVAVTALEPSRAPLQRALGEEVGGLLTQIHREKGVELLTEETAAELVGNGSVKAVRTKSGRLIECDFVVAGIGIQPVVDFLEGSGIDVDNGVLTDELCRTSVPDVFAAGDIANHANALLRERMRVEHWYNADWQGKAAALSMIGKGEPYAVVPRFWSTQYGNFFEYAGQHSAGAEVVIRGSLEMRTFLAFYLDQGRLKAAASLGRSEELKEAEPLIARRASVSAEQLRDEAVKLSSLEV